MPNPSRSDVTTKLLSEITCPCCAHRKVEAMPTDACQFFYECEGCHVVLRPKPGDCCVFCSYGSAPCPPVQLSIAERGGEDRPPTACSAGRSD